MGKIIAYFAPHQDDELNNLGVDICRECEKGHDVFCTLCTDGSSSFVRKFLGNGEECFLHPGRHVYHMERPEFAMARDREYRASCQSLGIREDRILISPDRAQDGSLSVEKAEGIIRDFLACHPQDEITVKVIMPASGCRQNPDHTNLGNAAKKLYAEGAFSHLELFFEPLLWGEPSPEKAEVERVDPENGEQRKKILKAVAAYNIWDPDKGFFAVGYHSVKDEFDAFAADPHTYRKIVG